MQQTELLSNSTQAPLTEPSTIAVKVLVGFILCLIIFMSITGNLLVCIAIYTDRRLRKLGNLFLVSLALADLFVAALVMTFAVANDLMEYWVFGPQFCDTWTAFDVMCSTASILNLCAISLDRYIHIKDPLRYSRWMTKKVVLLSISAIWLLSVLISFLPISLEWHRPIKNEQSSSQAKPICALELTALYAVVSSAISFYVPCVVMVAIYSRLYYYARKHVKSIRAVTKIAPSDSDSKRIRTLSQSSHIATDHKAAITLGIIMGTFLVCWVPFFCINIIAGFCKTCIPDDVFKTLTWLGYCNSALNPIIYSIFNTEFRDAFRKVLVTYLHTDRCPMSSCCCRRTHNRRTRDGKLYVSPPSANNQRTENMKESNGEGTQI